MTDGRLALAWAIRFALFRFLLHPHVLLVVITLVLSACIICTA